MRHQSQDATSDSEAVSRPMSMQAPARTEPAPNPIADLQRAAVAIARAVCPGSPMECIVVHFAGGVQPFVLPAPAQQVRPASLSASEAMVYDAIAAADEPLQQKQIAAETDLGERTIQRATSRLAKIGAIVHVPNEGFALPG